MEESISWNLNFNWLWNLIKNKLLLEYIIFTSENLWIRWGEKGHIEVLQIIQKNFILSQLVMLIKRQWIQGDLCIS